MKLALDQFGNDIKQDVQQEEKKMNVNLPKLPNLASLLKLGGVVLTAYGVNVNSYKEMTLGAAATAVIHLIDSVFNSPPKTQPKVTGV